MDLKSALLEEHSKAQCTRIVNYIGSDKKRFDELMDLFFNGHYRVNQRAAWPLSYIAESQPQLVEPYLEKLVYNLRKRDAHVAVKRNTVRLLQEIEVTDEDLMGELADICFGFLASQDETIAVKAFSMTVLYNITVKEPDLKNELKLLIEELLPYASSGLKNRGKKILIALEKL
jgi:hypothetical protein